MIRKINNNEISKLNKISNYEIGDKAFEMCFVYEIGKEIVGFIDFSDIYDRLELNYIWIDEKKRGKKYATDLIGYMIDYANKKRSIDNITLEVSKNNPIALHLYEKMGFISVALRKGYYNGVDGILMIRKFDKNE